MTGNVVLSPDASIFTAVATINIPAPPEQVWRFLTEPTLVSEWFAETAMMEPERPIRFDFGDGDFFEAYIVEWRAPTFLRLRWKFMAVGPTYRITFVVILRGEHTEVTVEDQGSLSPEEADELRQGWDDFLMRLYNRILSGAPARYQWSHTIGAAALIPNDCCFEDIIRDGRLTSVFPSCTTQVSPEDGTRLRISFNDAAWSGCHTEALMTMIPLKDFTFVKVSHTGWTKLSPDIQISERRRYAGYWAQFLNELELESV